MTNVRTANPQLAYLRGLLLVTAFAVACVAAFNYVIDPYAYFQSPRVAGFNALKPRPDDQIAVVKYEAALRVGADAIILGNSRVDVGLDPEYPAWAPLRAYNIGVPGAGICTAWWNLMSIAAHQRIKRAILGIEFLDFLTDSPPADCGATPDYFLRPRLADRGRALFTLGGLSMSARAVLLQRDPYPDLLTDRGFSPMRSYDRQAGLDGYYMMFEQRAEEYARNLNRLPHSLTAKGAATSLEFETLRLIVRHAVQSDERLDLIAYPYHLELLLLFEKSGVWPLFEQWKRHVVEIVAAEVPESARSRVRILDFTGPSGPQLEAISQPGDRQSITRWYWEAGHFKKALGDRVLDRVLTEPVLPVANADTAFGVELSAGNIEQSLLLQRRAMADAAAGNPGLANHVEQLVHNARR